MAVVKLNVVRKRAGLGLLLSAAAGLVAVLGGSTAQAAPAPAAPNPAATAPAQTSTPAPAPTPARSKAPAGPDRMAEMFGDWTLFCIRSGEHKACEVNLSVQDRQQQIVATLAISGKNVGKPRLMVARLPVNVTTTEPVRLVLEGDGTVLLPLRNCNAAGCFGQLELTDDAILSRLRARDASTGHRLEWNDAGGASVGIAVSFRGIGNALDALVAAGL